MINKDKTKRKNLHEKFHSKTGEQRKIINEHNFTYRNILPVLKKYTKNGDQVLDIGCGSGTLSLYLAAKGNKVDGIDISDKAIKQCTRSAINLGLEKNTHFKIMDFPAKIPNKQYDLIILIEVIEHLPNDGFVIKQLFKLLKTGGKVILSTPSQNAPLHRLGFAKSFDKRVGHLRRYTLHALIRLMNENGFKVVETHKTEGVVRNFLFVSSFAGKFIRFVKYFMVDIVSYIDDLSRKIFGESNFILVAEKK